MSRLSVTWSALAGAACLACAGGPAAASTAEAHSRAERDRRDAEYALQEARGALAREEWAQAELLLERVLMLRPESAEALIELARLLAQRGRVSEAVAMLRALADDPRTPPEQARTLSSAIATAPAAGPAMASPATTGATTSRAAFAAPAQWRLEALAGYSSNPLVVTSASSITLTLPDGAFQLPLETTPQRAAYAGITGAVRLANGAEAMLQAQQVDLQGQRAAYRAALFWPLHNTGTALVSSLLRIQQFGDGSQRHQIDLQATHMGPWTAQLGWFDEPERRRHGPVGRVEWAAPLRPHLQLGIWAEAEGNRGVGAPGHAGLGVRLLFQPHAAWVIHLQSQAQADTSGYSQLLENNARRVLKTQQISLEHAIGGNPSSPWRLKLYNSIRISNLALFSWRDTGMQLVWRKSW